MARPAAAPAVFRLLAFEISRDDVADRRAEGTVIGDTKRGEEGDLADQDSVVKAAWGRRGAGGDVELKSAANAVLDVHRCNREVRLVVGVGACAILTHGDPIR